MNVIYPIVCSIYIYLIYPVLFNRGLNKNNILSVLFFTLPIFITTATQVNIGTDYPSYIGLYTGYYDFSITNGVLFYYLFDVLNLITPNPRLLFVVVSIFQFFLLWGVISSFMKKFGRGDFTLAFLIVYFSFTYLSGFNLLRAYLASLVLIYAFLNCFIERRWFYYVFLVLVAFLFHPTAIIFILLPFIYLLLNRNIPFVVLCLISVAFFISGQVGLVAHISQWLYDILPVNTPYRFYLVSKHMSPYIHSFGIGMFVNLFFCISSSYFISKEKDQRIIGFCNLGVVAYLLGMLFYFIPIFNRMLYYFIFFQSFLLSYMFVKMSKSKFLFFGFIPVVYMVFYFYISYYSVQQFNGNL